MTALPVKAHHVLRAEGMVWRYDVGPFRELPFAQAVEVVERLTGDRPRLAAWRVLDAQLVLRAS